MPATGVDLVFDMNSLNPVSRSSIIHDTDPKNQTITIAQPLIPITDKTSYEELHLTVIIYSKNRKMRVGLQCQPIKFDDHYRLTNQIISKAVILKYKLPVAETNIRSAFRLPLSQKHTIKAKMIYRQTNYYTPNDFNTRDISLTGMGLTIPQKKTPPSPLISLKTAEVIPLGIILIDTIDTAEGEKKKERPIGTFALKTKVVRVNQNYSDSHILVGLKIINMNQKNETLLNRFIHKAQIDELKRLRVKR